MATKKELEAIIEMNSRIGRLMINKTRTTKQKFKEILVIVNQTMNVDRIGIFLKNKEKIIVPVATFGYDSKSASCEYPLGKGLIGQATLNGETIYCPDITSAGKDEPQKLHAEVGIYRDMRSALIIPLKVDGDHLGAIEIISEKPNAFSPQEIEGLKSIRNNLSTYIAYLTQQRNGIIEKTRAIYSTLEFKHEYLKGHSQRVQLESRKIARVYGLSKEKIELIADAASLHDVGKVGIMDVHLSSDKRYSDKDNPIKSHALSGYKLLRENGITEKILLNVVLSHHEWWNGQGYPHRLKGEDIPLEARIVCVADSADAMLSDRPYRKALSLHETVKELKEGRGKQFDPDLIMMYVPILIRDYKGTNRQKL